jgi:hypothetical protein
VDGDEESIEFDEYETETQECRIGAEEDDEIVWRIAGACEGYSENDIKQDNAIDGECRDVRK